MYAYIRGILARTEDQALVLEVGGIGYRLRVGGQTLAAMPALGEEVLLHTYTYVREDALALYGFADPGHLELFQLLLGVSGIGPKAALALLDALGGQGLRLALACGDVAALAKAPGIGKKIAARLALELRGKLSLDVPMAGEPAVTPEAPPAKQEALEALMALGYGRAEAWKALSGLPEDMESEALLRQALRLLL